jgi:MFS family permease
MSKKLFGIDLDVFLLGLVSFFTDVSSEMIFSVFSIFFTVILGASVFLLGILEGLADLASTSLDYISGFISDKTGKRKKYAFAGYFLSAIGKLIMVFTTTLSAVFSFRIIDRLGKSIRGSPRDAWLSSIAEKSKRGYSFGIHQTLDQAGAIVGPLLAYAILSYFGQTSATFSLLFKLAFIPAIIGLGILLMVKDRPSIPKRKSKFFSSYKGFGKELKHYISTAEIFSLAYFSFGFLLLKAYLVGFAIKDVILIYTLFNVSALIFSIPIGKIGDYLGRKKIILLSYVIYFIMSIGFIIASTKIFIILLFVLFGLFYAIDESQTKAYISDLERQRRATAIGIYNFITGLIYLFASVIAGYLWKINPNYAFIFAAVISLIAIIFFISKRSN